MFTVVRNSMSFVFHSSLSVLDIHHSGIQQFSSYLFKILQDKYGVN